MNPVILHIEDPDHIAKPIFSNVVAHDFISETQPHQHSKTQLLYVMSGVVTVEAAGGIWTVPPRCALWMPSGIAHSGRAAGPIKIANIYVEPELAQGMREQCGIIFVPPLLRELILKFIQGNVPHINADMRGARLTAVLLDELEAAAFEPLHLPMPNDRRLRRLVETLLGNPALRFSIEEWGARIGTSSRTLSRLFQRETGMSFVRWRQQLHIGLALRGLAEGQPVTNIAVELGYESASAFILMFRRMLGTTPARYFNDSETRSSEAHELGQSP